jgi:thioester reductase-like protein
MGSAIMPRQRPVLLTGATGFLGSYLLRDLIVADYPTAVLVRPSSTDAVTRIAERIAFWSDRLRRSLPQPYVLAGDLAAPGLGLSWADRAWLGARRPIVVHAAARVAFQRSDAGEPWITNLDGTRRLLELCADLGMGEFHHVSTAFVCGERTDRVFEEAPEQRTQFHNDYEASKYEAETLVRSAPHLRATIYRPSVLVGDSRTGYTCSYQGLYRFLKLADRLAPPRSEGGSRRPLPLRLPFTGAERRDLAPVDWVAQAIVRLVSRPECCGRTYHLTAAEPIAMEEIKQAAEEVLHLEGVSWAGRDGLSSRSALEETFQEHLREYWPYLNGDPAFDRSNTQFALPDLPCPRLDRELLERLIRFGRADGWGRRRTTRTERCRDLDCSHYLESFLPENAPRSVLSRLVALNLTVAVEVRGPGGGRWSCRWIDGQLADVERGLTSAAAVTYRTDVDAFAEVIGGRLSPQEAFFARRFDVEGDVEKGLKLAVLFGRFVEEFPYRNCTEGRL